MKAAKLLLLAYRSYKKGLTPIAEKIFAEAMSDETAPDLMEKLHVLETEESDTDTQENENTEEDTEILIEEDENTETETEEETEESLAEVLSETQVAQLKAIANIIASKNASDLANKILAIIQKK